MSSLAEISRICGVSLGATSKALSGKPGVSEATRQRILSVAAQKNYRPNRLVHAIQSGRSMTIGLTCSDFQSEFSGRILEGMLEVLYAADYDAIVISWDLCVHSGEKVLHTFAERRVDGLLMFPPADQPSQAYLHELKNFNRPIVVLDQTFAGSEEYDFVGSQDFEGGMLATEHLIALGHRKIAHIGHRKSSTGRARLDGFKQAMAKHGLPIHERWNREIENYGSDEAYHYAHAMLSGKTPPTAIIAFNDHVALEVMAAAHDLGLTIPCDVSVVGFADVKAASVIRPRLTTIAQDPQEMGRRAANRLLHLLKETSVRKTARTPAHSPTLDRLSTRLVVRDSTAPPAERR